MENKDQRDPFPLTLQEYMITGRGQAIVSAVRKRTSFFQNLSKFEDDDLVNLFHEIVDECRMSKPNQV